MKKAGLFLFFTLSTTMLTIKTMAPPEHWDTRGKDDWRIMCMTALDKAAEESAAWCKHLSIRNTPSPNTEIAAIMTHKIFSHARQDDRTLIPIDRYLEDAAKRERLSQLIRICHTPDATSQELQEYLDLKKELS